jgi:hypothetical protein
VSYECYVWLVREADGREAPVAAIMDGRLGPMVLQHSDHERALQLEPFARAHAKASGQPVRLAHLVECSCVHVSGEPIKP